MIVLASCQDVAEQPGPIEPVTFAPEYPSLHTVPARPQLSYTVEQKRAIVDMLIADRVNARYTEGVVRYRAGLSSEPPPPAPALAAVPESELRALGAAPAITPPVGARPAPAAIPETEFQQEKDSLDSFMQDMVNSRTRSQGPADPAPAGRPDANAAPLGTSRAGAGASELIAQPAAYPPGSQVVVLAMPPDPASLPPPRPAPPLGSLEAQDLASLGAQYKAVPPPPADGPILTERAPGAVWATPEMASVPADDRLAMLADASADAGLPPHADLQRADTNLAERAPGVAWGMPEMAPAPADGPQAMLADAAADAELPPQADLARAETTLAGGAPGVVWGIPDTAPAPAAPPTSQIAQVETAARAGAMVGVAQEPGHAAPPGPSAPAPDEPLLAGRAPGVIWGMPDPAPAPAGRVGAPPSTRVAETATAPLPGPLKPTPSAEMVLAGQAGAPAPTTPPARHPAPPAPAPAKPARPAAADTLLAGVATAPVGGRIEQTGAAESPAATTMARALLPAPAKPTPDGSATAVEPITVVAADRPAPQPGAGPAAGGGIEITDGLVAIDVTSSRDRDGALGSIPFRPKSAMLTPDAVVLLAELLNGAGAPAARIRVVGEAAAPGLALDRARAVGLALVQGGVPADRLELTLAHGGSGDQARLFLAAPEL